MEMAADSAPGGKALLKTILKALKGAEGRRLPFKRLRKCAMPSLEAVVGDKGARKAIAAAAISELAASGKVEIAAGSASGRLVTYVGKRKRVGGDTSASAAIEEVAQKPGKKSAGVVTMTPAAAASSEMQREGAREEQQRYPTPPPGTNTILLFYTYCPQEMTRQEQDEAIAHCYKVLKESGCTGRLRIGREGYNGTLTGPHDAMRAFTKSMATFDPATFGNDRVDFKFVDGQRDNQLLKGLKVWPVTEIVTYGLTAADAPMHKGGKHLSPAEYHAAMEDPNSVMIDVRNYNESLIGKFAPPGDKVLDPCMRKSTEFPQWVQDNRHRLEGKKVLLYCTAGVRCERASAYMQNCGIEDVNQLQGGIHRYLEAYPQDGGYWVGKNYTFDKRFNHGAQNAQTISLCVVCANPWDRYQAQKKCLKCRMEVIVCKVCQKDKASKHKLFCPLCSGKGAPALPNA